MIFEEISIVIDMHLADASSILDSFVLCFSCSGADQRWVQAVYQYLSWITGRTNAEAFTPAVNRAHYEVSAG